MSWMRNGWGERGWRAKLQGIKCLSASDFFFLLALLAFTDHLYYFDFRHLYFASKVCVYINILIA